MLKRSVEEIVYWIRSEFVKRFQIPLDDVDVNVPLTNLGLDSISVLSFVNDLSEWIGDSVPINAIFYHPTIIELSRFLSIKSHISSEVGSLEQQQLLIINPDLPGAPLYAIHPAGGNAMSYTELSKALGCPIIAIQGKSQITLTVSHPTSIDDLAQQYASIFLNAGHKVDHLLGFSFGGVVAYEMAKYLPDLQHIFLLDSAAPGHAPGQALGVPTDKEATTTSGSRRLESSDDDASGIIMEERRRMAQIGWAIIFPRIRALNRSSYFPVGIREQFFADTAAAFDCLPQAISTERTGSSTIQVTLLRATAFEDDIERAFGHPRYRKKDFGWHAIDPLIEVLEVPGADHFTIMMKPHAELVAELIHCHCRRRV